MIGLHKRKSKKFEDKIQDGGNKKIGTIPKLKNTIFM